MTNKSSQEIMKENYKRFSEFWEKARNKEKDKEIKSIVNVIDNLIGRFGKEKDFDDKVEKKLQKEQDAQNRRKK